MMFMDAALHLASLGFHVFPLVPNSKLPLIEGFPTLATRDPEQIRRWWFDPILEIGQPYNIGISTSRFGDAEALIVIDVDVKKGKDGNAELRRLVAEGNELPATLEQVTPSGGRHLVYRSLHACKQGTDLLARGLDIRSRGGYVVGAGSIVEEGTYTQIHRDLACAPGWLTAALGTDRKEELRSDLPEARAKSGDARAYKRASQYLVGEAPLAVSGQAGDQTTFKVAARVKDFGVTEDEALQLLVEFWNPRCEPPWSEGELRRKVANAFRYGREAEGAADPRNEFEPVVEARPRTKVDELNDEYAYIAGSKGYVIHETTDANGRFKLEHIALDVFHTNLAAKKMRVGEKKQPVSKVWLASPFRRSYDGLTFLPGKKAPINYYNLWRGFAVDPLSAGGKAAPAHHAALDAFLEHALQNACGGDPALFAYLMSYFAHLVQEPWERPNVALVFRGEKGVGKNALIERVGALLGDHYVVVSRGRHLTGNFNSLLENKLMITFDEAFWSGDKQAEGILKDMITGSRHTIERKGKEPYTIENCLRVSILGNEDWLVAASNDERRYAVFDVGAGRKQDLKFFHSMREGMEQGGYRLLLRYLLDFKISVEVRHPPITQALTDQKMRSSSPFNQWWSDCLRAGGVLGSEFEDLWPEKVEKGRFREAFYRHLKERNFHSRYPTDSEIGKDLRRVLPPDFGTYRARESGGRVNYYWFPTLSEARKQFEVFMRTANYFSEEEMEDLL